MNSSASDSGKGWSPSQPHPGGNGTALSPCNQRRTSSSALCRRASACLCRFRRCFSATPSGFGLSFSSRVLLPRGRPDLCRRNSGVYSSASAKVISTHQSLTSSAVASLGKGIPSRSPSNLARSRHPACLLIRDFTIHRRTAGEGGTRGKHLGGSEMRRSVDRPRAQITLARRMRKPEQINTNDGAGSYHYTQRIDYVGRAGPKVILGV